MSARDHWCNESSAGVVSLDSFAIRECIESASRYRESSGTCEYGRTLRMTHVRVNVELSYNKSNEKACNASVR